ncbi:hypothetical protein Sjap_023146 [Stephania japonica]|uniref:MtN19-like protein n=1 Tax=Stephania japonica TaxID=461633 RepID=A0AAP0HK71_9MAGN
MPSHFERGSLLFSFLLLLLLLLVSSRLPPSQALPLNQKGLKSAVFLSPKFVQGPGSVGDKFYYDVDFPRGHIFLKDFIAEVVDEEGNSVPLHETYLHHWLMVRYFERKDVDSSGNDNNQGRRPSDFIMVPNSGVCGHILGQYFGLGSETRRTTTYIPDPYGIEIGNPEEIPHGYEEKWLLNVHAIDTRGVEDRLGCTECRCDLYNVTKDKSGKPLRPGYLGGLYCCYDETRCRVKKHFNGLRRSLYLRYTVKWVDWEKTIVPVKIYILDVTDTRGRADYSTSISARVGCQVEYDVEECVVVSPNNGCTDSKRISVFMANGGDVIYGAAHQHSGGTGAALYGQDGRLVCSSIPIYGEGKEAGNEAGYIVGMSSCYPRPGTVKISNGETLYLESNYSSTRGHTGVMGLFYLLVAEQSPKQTHLAHGLIHMHDQFELFKVPRTMAYAGAALIIVAAAAAVYLLRKGRENEHHYVAV